MNVAHLVEIFPKASETFILNQLSGIIDEGHDVQVFAKSKPDSPVDHEIIEEYNLLDKVTYINHPDTYLGGVKSLSDSVSSLLTNGFGPRTILPELRYKEYAPRRLANLRHLHGYDLRHAHFGHVAKSFLCNQKVNSPLIVSFYGYDASRVPRSYGPSFYDGLFDQTTIVTCLSDDMRGDLEDIGCPPDKLRKVPLCINVDKFPYEERTRSSGEPTKIFTAARLVEKKGLEYAIRAVAEIDEEHDVSYSIAGDGPKREELERLIRELDAEDCINILGWQSQEQISELMSDSHIFLLPSVTAENGDKEGTPTVLLEAQSVGLPVVSTEHAGIPEIVDDGETGMLVPERDVKSLTEALDGLISHPERWSEMGRKGRKKTEENHSIEVVVDRLLTLYEEALEPARQSR